MAARNGFIILFVAIAGLFFWLGGQFFHRLYQYVQLSVEVPASLEHWKIEEQSNGTFSVQITYAFEWEGQRLQKEGALSNKGSPNWYVAKEALDKWKRKGSKVWLNPKDIEMVALKKKFPFLEGVKTFFCLGVFVYFLFLKKLVKKVFLVESQPF